MVDSYVSYVKKNSCVKRDVYNVLTNISTSTHIYNTGWPTGAVLCVGPIKYILFNRERNYCFLAPCDYCKKILALAGSVRWWFGRSG